MNKKFEKRIQELSPEQFEITQHKGTEVPFTGKFNDHNEKGMYLCTVCGVELFSSQNKFNSGSGWPSFDRSASDKSVNEKSDSSLGTQRTEVVCTTCGAHLGHVFDDGPKASTGKRYCINSASLNFKKDDY
jgi:peptide-methionine (R)-S-oxide reductase